MLQRLVVDSNMLQSLALRAFLSQSDSHFAVLPEFAWFEIYKQQSLAGLAAGLSVVGDFPDQLIVLRPWHKVAAINARCPELVDNMCLDGVAGDVRQMVEALAYVAGDETDVSVDLAARWASAAYHANDMLAGAEDVAISLPEIVGIFSVHETQLCRAGGRYTWEMFEKIFGAADQLYENFAEGHGVVTHPEASQDRHDSYLHRQALATMIYALWWIRNGSQVPKRLDKVRNDIIDLNFAVHGTYFDGLMTEDAKARSMFNELSGGLGMARALAGLAD